MKIRKLKIEIISVSTIHSLTQFTVEFLLICLISLLQLNEFQTGTISASESLCSQFYRWKFPLELCNWHFMAIMQMITSVASMQVLRWSFLLLVWWCIVQLQLSRGLFQVEIVLLEISGAHMQLTVSAANMWVTNFVIMQMEVSVAIMQAVFSAVQYAHDCFYCNYAD